MHEKLSHLTEEQVVELTKRYIDGERPSNLLDHYSIDARPSSLASLLPPIERYDLPCPYCNDAFLSERVTSSSRSRRSPPKCSKCSHQDSEHCTCENCKVRRAEHAKVIEGLQRDVIELRYDRDDYIAPSIHDLSFRDALFLLTLYRHSVSEDLATCEPFKDEPPPLAPTYELQNDLVKHLYSKDLIAISQQSTTNAFVFDEDITETTAYYPTRVIWTFLPGLDVAEKRDFIRTLTTLIDDEERWPENWVHSMNAIWHVIGKYEAIEYYLFQLSKRGFDLEEIGPKTHGVFEELLLRFSVSQIYNLTWQAVRDTTDYVVREGIPKYRAKNTFIGAIQRKADRYIAEGWELRNSRRDFDCPQSVLSATYFNVFEGSGDKGFATTPPNI